MQINENNFTYLPDPTILMGGPECGTLKMILLVGIHSMQKQFRRKTKRRGTAFGIAEPSSSGVDTNATLFSFELSSKYLPHASLRCKDYEP